VSGRAASHDGVCRSYDEVADEYARHLGGELAYKPLDRALLAALVELAGVGAPIADLGCGPGHVTAFLADLGADAVGIDLSRRMVDLARRDHPQVEFRQGDLLSLPAFDNEFGAAVAFYSLIHLAPDEHLPALVEVHRSLRAAAPFLVSFHIGSEVRHLDDWWGHEVDLDFHFFESEDVIENLVAAGFALEATLERASYGPEVETRRAYLLARRT
jgi:SAM-dependent methyltransferase